MFADKPGGGNNLVYRNLSEYRQLELQSIVHQVRIDVGDVVWAFFCPVSLREELDTYINKLSIEYIQSEIQSSKDNNDGRISEEAMNVPEIASGLEKFEKDYSNGKKPSRLLAQFGSTVNHCLLMQ